MHEWLGALREGQVVIDLGCHLGSFDVAVTKAMVVQIDLSVPPANRSNFVTADAARMPIADGSVDLVVANHSLEHFHELEFALREIGRVVKGGGALFVSVPDASTVTDKLYRWLGRGGGHVNQFYDPQGFAQLVESATGLKHFATRTLHSGLSFLNRKNSAHMPWRLIALGGGAEWMLQAVTFLFRKLDQALGTRFSVYGWAFYFGQPVPLQGPPWTNVCVRCGSASSAEWLEACCRVRRKLGLKYYDCPHCQTFNFFTPDKLES